MKALTLWRPWSDAIVHGPKRVENRGWPPPAGVLGTLIAIHAGKRHDVTVFGGFPESYEPPANEGSPTGIVGVARVIGYLDLRKPRRRHAVDMHNFASMEAYVACLDQDPWWVGPCGWLLDDVLPLSTPIDYPGSLGLWRVPPEVVDQITERLCR